MGICAPRLTDLQQKSGAETAGSTQVKVESLQALRLFASLGVFQYHLWWNYLGIRIGHPGTDFFLVLVGTVAALTQVRQIPTGNWKRYLLSRLIRLYVAYIPLFFLVLAAKYPAATFDWVWRSFFFIPIADREPVIGCTWMLSNFMLFYLIFSVAVFVRDERVLLPIFIAWLAGIIAHSWLGWTLGIAALWADLLFADRNLEMILGFSAGVLLRHRYVTIKAARMLVWAGMAAIAISVGVLNARQTLPYRSLALGLPIACFVWGMATLEREKAHDRLVRVLTWPGLVWLGSCSYVLYLSHSPFVRIWSLALPVTPAWVPVITLGAVAAAAIGTKLWEEPLLRWFHARLKKRPPVGNTIALPSDA